MSKKNAPVSFGRTLREQSSMFPNQTTRLRYNYYKSRTIVVSREFLKILKFKDV